MGPREIRRSRPLRAAGDSSLPEPGGSQDAGERRDRRAAGASRGGRLFPPAARRAARVDRDRAAWLAPTHGTGTGGLSRTGP